MSEKKITSRGIKLKGKGMNKISFQQFEGNYTLKRYDHGLYPYKVLYNDVFAISSLSTFPIVGNVKMNNPVCDNVVIKTYKNGCIMIIADGNDQNETAYIASSVSVVSSMTKIDKGIKNCSTLLDICWMLEKMMDDVYKDVCYFHINSIY